MPPDSPVAVDAHLGHPRLGPRRASAAMERVRAMAAGQGSRRARQPDETSHAGGRLRRFTQNGSAQYSTGRLLPCLTMISWGETGAPGASVPSMPPSSTSSAQVDLAARALTHHARIVKRLRACEREFKSASRSRHDASDASAAGASRRKIAIDATVRKKSHGDARGVTR